ncbi:MAG: DUF2148 domain-containing protein [Candidatus Eremiobacteraeota bacterium]|nr:DUF2148 domain-containing protein [Candidatus Eremiobacteraeota bacterium]
MKILETVAELMDLAARTAPKSAGQDYILTRILSGAEVNALADAMIKHGTEKGKKNFDRDGENVRRSPVVLLVGVKDAKPVGLNCGACGAMCADIKPADHGEFRGPHCALRLLDMGIAIGSAVKTAQLLNADNRIMYRIGAAAISAGMIDWDFAMGIPISASGKSIYFDR